MFKLLSYQLTAEFFAWASQLDSTAPLFVVPATFRPAFAMSSMKLRMKPFRHSRKHRKRSIIRCIWLAVWFDLDWALLENVQNQFLYPHLRHPRPLRETVPAAGLSKQALTAATCVDLILLEFDTSVRALTIYMFQGLLMCGFDPLAAKAPIAATWKPVGKFWENQGVLWHNLHKHQLDDSMAWKKAGGGRREDNTKEDDDEWWMMNHGSWIMDHGWWMMNDKCWMMTDVKQCGWNIIHQHLDVWYIVLSTGGCSRAGNWVTITMTMSMEASCIGYVGKPPMLLQTDAFTHICFADRCLYTQNFSHPAVFTHSCCYTERFLHGEIFTHRHLDTQFF